MRDASLSRGNEPPRPLLVVKQARIRAMVSESSRDRVRCGRVCPVRIFGVDVGSIRTGRFAWALADPADAAVRGEGHDPATLADRIKEELGRGKLVALGFECPLVLPVPDLWDHLG